MPLNTAKAALLNRALSKAVADYLNRLESFEQNLNSFGTPSFSSVGSAHKELNLIARDLGALSTWEESIFDFAFLFSKQKSDVRIRRRKIHASTLRLKSQISELQNSTRSGISLSTVRKDFAALISAFKPHLAEEKIELSALTRLRLEFGKIQFKCRPPRGFLWARFSIGNIPQIISLIVCNPKRKLDILSSHIDFAHTKLLETIQDSGVQLRTVVEGQMFRELIKFCDIRTDSLKFLWGLHARCVITENRTIISSADLNVDSFCKHTEAGTMVKTHKDISTFFDKVWASSVPSANYRLGFLVGPTFQTVALALLKKDNRKLNRRTKIGLGIELRRSFEDFICTRDLTGYSADYKDLNLLLFNFAKPLDASLNQMLANKLIHDGLQNFFHVCPLQEVGSVSERIVMFRNCVKNAKRINLLYLSTDRSEDVKNEFSSFLETLKINRVSDPNIPQLVRAEAVKIDGGDIIRLAAVGKSKKEKWKDVKSIIMLRLEDKLGISPCIHMQDMENYSLIDLFNL